MPDQEVKHHEGSGDSGRSVEVLTFFEDLGKRLSSDSLPVFPVTPDKHVQKFICRAASEGDSFEAYGNESTALFRDEEYDKRDKEYHYSQGDQQIRHNFLLVSLVVNYIETLSQNSCFVKDLQKSFALDKPNTYPHYRGRRP